MPPLHRTFRSADGLCLAYREFGAVTSRSPAIVCLPGMTRNGRDFEPFARTLPQRRALCPDLRGRGRSEYARDPLSYRPSVYVDDLRELLDAAAVERVVLVGASLGGAVAMLGASRLGERVAGIILVDVGPDAAAADPARIGTFLRAPLAAPSWEAAAQSLAARQAADFPAYHTEDWLAAARRLCSQHADGWIRADYDPALALAYERAEGVEQWDRWRVFESLAALPLLVVRGALSGVLSAATLERMRMIAPRLVAVEVAGVGHHPMLTEPEALRAIADFLR